MNASADFPASSHVATIAASTGSIPMDPAREAEVADAAASIDLSDPASIDRFGAEAQDRMASFVDEVIRGARGMDAGEAGTIVADVLLKAKELSPSDLGRWNLARLFGGARAQVERFVARYTEIERQIDSVKGRLAAKVTAVEARAAQVTRMYELNFEQFGHLEVLIQAGRRRIDDARMHELPAAEREAEGGDHAAIERAIRLRAAIDALDVRIFDLESARMDCIQTAQQLRLIEANAAGVSRVVRGVLVGTISNWKRQFAIALSLHEQREATALAGAVRDADDAMRRSNARMLKSAVHEAAREAQRPTIGVETLTVVHDELIAALDGLQRISLEGERAREEGRRTLERLEGGLRARLLSKG